MAAVAHSGFFQHAKLVFTENPEQYGNYRRNRREQVGQTMMWHVVKLPVHIYNALHNPKVLVVAFGALAMLSVQFAFYPATTLWAARTAIQMISFYIPRSYVKFAAYGATQIAIAGWVIRSLGRLGNGTLMDRFYGRERSAQA